MTERGPGSPAERKPDPAERREPGLPPPPEKDPGPPPPERREPGPTPPPAEEPGSPPPEVREPEPAPPPQRARARGFDLGERPETTVLVPRDRLRRQSRRDFLLFTAGTVATAAGAWWLLPDRTKARLLTLSGRDRLDTVAARVGLTRERRERVLNGVLTFDDDVAEALYSEKRTVRTYRKDQVTRLPNNYHGRTPSPEILTGWRLEVSGLASGRTERLALDDLYSRFHAREQVTRLVCVEGWSAIAWWGGIRFPDFLRAFPPAPEARWAALRSEVSLDARGRPEPYYVSLDLGTARHPQTLLATHQGGRPLSLAHGAPLRLLAPMKLGLKNIKAITHIAYVAEEPHDYWAERGYSRFDGL